MNFWLIRGDPRQNDFAAFMVPGREDEWHTKQPPRTWVPGDRVFFWASSPQLELVGLGEFTGLTGEMTPQGESIYGVRYRSGVLDRPLSIGELQADPVVRNAIFLKRGPATSVTRLSVEEGERLYQLAASHNPTIVGLWAELKPGQERGAWSVQDLDAEATEGEPRLHEHLRRERDQSIINRKKKAVLRATGALRCEACGFDFHARYGVLGTGFCEIHHRVPLAALDGARQTRLRDLAVLCSNCHRMIHRTRPLLSVEAFREHISKLQVDA